MFVLTTISDVIQISPADFVKPSAQAIEDNIHEKYSNRVLQQVGLCICFWDLLKASEGLISQGDGMVNVNVVFRLVVFRPFKGEIIQGSIIDANPEGIRIGLDFFNDIWIPASNLFDGSAFTYRDNEQVWIWTTDDGNEFFYDVGEKVRFRVEHEVWHDHLPQRPNFDMDEDQQALADLDREVPYTVIGSMSTSGMAPLFWWEDNQETSMADAEPGAIA